MFEKIKNKIDEKISQFENHLDISSIAEIIYKDNQKYFDLVNHLKEESKTKLDDYLFKKYNLVFSKEKYLSSNKK